MNSLEELNNYVSGLNFEFIDERISTVNFNLTAPINQSIIVNEGETFALPVGIEILEVINYSVSLPNLTVDISSVDDDGVTVDWPTVPSSCTITEPFEGTDGNYNIDGIESKAIWDIVKSPNIVLPTNLPNAFFGNFTITVTIDYVDGNLGAQTLSYTVAVSVQNVTFMTTPTTAVYETETVTLLENTPQIVDIDAQYPGANFTIDGSFNDATSITDLTSTSTSGGTFSYDSVNETFQITGTRAQANAHLSALNLESNSNEIDFTIFYVLSNDQDGTTDSKQQAVRNENTLYLSNTAPFLYTEDVQTQVSGNPIINDLDYSGSDDYTITIQPADTAKVANINSFGTGGTTNFNNGTKTLTITGTKSVVNDHLANLELRPAEEVDDLFVLVYSLTTPQANNAVKNQQLVCGSNDEEISNAAVTRNYTANNANSIFENNTPQIVDLDVISPNNYTLFLSSDIGEFSDDGFTSANPYSVSGTKAQINALLPNIIFYPNAGVSANDTATIQLDKNGSTIRTQDFVLNGSASSFTDEEFLEIFATQTFTPTIEQVLYADFDVVLFAGGGGGGYFGGGGGGEIKSIFQVSVSQQTYNLVVGTGGAAGVNGNDTTAFGYTAEGGRAGNEYNGGRGGGTTYRGSGGNGIFGAGGGGGAGGSNTPTPGAVNPNGEAYNPSGATSGGDGGDNVGYEGWVGGDFQEYLSPRAVGVYAGGGGGGANNGFGGSVSASGGGGAQGSTNATDGRENRGGGGGGGNSVGGQPGRGGDGQILIEIYEKGSRS